MVLRERSPLRGWSTPGMTPSGGAAWRGLNPPLHVCPVAAPSIFPMPEELAFHPVCACGSEALEPDVHGWHCTACGTPWHGGELRPRAGAGAAAALAPVGPELPLAHVPEFPAAPAEPVAPAQASDIDLRKA